MITTEKQSILASTVVKLARHPERPLALDFITFLAPDFQEIAGDRLFGDDPAMVCGFGHFQGERMLFIGQHKGRGPERVKRNYGMANPEGYRKALRAMRLAERFNIPIVTFIDTPGAFAGLAAEERGQALAIAENLLEMFNISSPIIVMITGEGCSGGAIGIGIGDRIAMLENSYYTVISPEGCASILWKDAKMSDRAAEALRLDAPFLKSHEIIDAIIEEVEGGAHLDPLYTLKKVSHFLEGALKELKELSKERLLELRYKKFRKMGAHQGLSDLSCFS